MSKSKTYCTEPGKSFVTNISRHLFIAQHNHIDSEVKLDSVKEQWFVEVPLDNNLFLVNAVRKFIQLVEQTNRITLTSNLWFCNVGGLGVGFHI